jgi:hypothetical protein
MNGSPVALTRRLRSEFGLGRTSTYYALGLMEKAGLVSVVRRKGRAPRVTMWEIEEEAPGISHGGEREQELGDYDSPGI